MAGKRALITGITGQDGSYLAELLIEKGYEVHGLVRRSSSMNRARIDHLFEERLSSAGTAGPHYLHYGDLTDASSVNRLLREIRPDEIYNLGAQSHVKGKGHVLFWVLGAAALAGLFWILRRTRVDREAALFLGLSFCLTVGTFGIIVVTRAYVADIVQRNILWDIRYSFLPGVVAELSWMWLFLAWWRDRDTRRRLAAVGVLGMALVAGNDLKRWRHVPERPDAHWPTSAHSIQRVLDQRARGELTVATDVSGIRMHPFGTKFERLTVTIPPSVPPRSS